MSNKLTVNNELKDYYFIEVSDVGNGLNYFFNESDYQRFILLIGEINGLVSYCLTSNNVKLLFNGFNSETLGSELSFAINSCCEYFNNEHDDQNQIKNAVINISDVTSFDELLNVSKSIHTTPESWLHHPHSSIRAYLYDDVPEFLEKSHISNIYGSAVEYFEYLNKQ